MKTEHTKALHHKYVTGVASASERQILRELLVHAPEDELLDFEEVLNLVEEDICMDASTSEAIYAAVIGTAYKTKSASIPLWWRSVAAAVVLLIMLSAYFLWGRDAPPTLYTNNTSFIKEILLEDHSTVLLKQGSTLQVLSDFKRDTIRSVRLVGEAFFTVSKNKSKPFVVVDEHHFNVKVLGTQFNLKLNKAQGVLVLNTGAVEVSRGPLKASVRPGERVDFDDRHRQFRIAQVDTAAHSAWKYNLIYFTAVPLSNIVNELNENHPDQSIRLDSRYSDHRFSGYLPQQDLDKTIKLLNTAYNDTIITK